MMLVTPWKRWVGAMALALGMLACGSEDDGDVSDGGADAATTGTSGGLNGAASGDGGGDGGSTTGMDGSATGDEDGGTGGDEDGGTGGDEDAGGDAGDAGEDAGGDAGDSGNGETPATLLDLPADGELTSICYGDDDCNGDDLECFASSGEAPGVCTEDCGDDDDCSMVDGLQPTCSDGLCVVNCAGDDEEGDGPCPQDMECRDLAPALVGLLNPNFWCVYPEEGGSNDAAELGKCDPDHGDGDCQGELACHDPGSNDHGYCTATCEEDEECTVPGGLSTTAAVCSNSGFCELDCAGAGATCPAGMNCRPVPLSISDDYRCVYID